eukprot:TRINITY_DN2053_c0_g3_i2.p1 TRINITY_DN2053_c0_g3~~TRINITY_DN2053_c0_g3_i2.p1  ORF type:complete len:320 (-),score=46.89 TRINITY_DN2053_c0_g3_i2:29-988(-)
MVFTTTAKESAVASTHCTIPLNSLLRKAWLNLSLDVANYFSVNYKGGLIVDRLTICSHCKLRKIFMMNRPIDIIESNGVNVKESLDKLPKSVEYPEGINFFNQSYSPNGILISQPVELEEHKTAFIERSKTPKPRIPNSKETIKNTNEKLNAELDSRRASGLDCSEQSNSRILKAANMKLHSPLVFKSKRGNRRIIKENYMTLDKYLSKEPAISNEASKSRMCNAKQSCRPVLSSNRSMIDIKECLTPCKKTKKVHERVDTIKNSKENCLKKLSNEDVSERDIKSARSEKLSDIERETQFNTFTLPNICLLYTSDAADE